MVDFFGGAGGAGRGYQLAGFHVTGVDINPQPRYAGDEFIQGDALELMADHAFMDQFAAAHGSPPCQKYSAMSGCRPGLADSYPDLVAVTRNLLTEWGRPWVIENVQGSGLAEHGDLFGANGLLLCGAMFGAALYRHRLFESSIPIAAPDHPRHLIPASAAGHWVPGSVISVAGNCSPIALAREVMGIDWMTRSELAESIPPNFTKYIGEHLLAHLAVTV
jgi:DNA (cytosine-5)-methyltransferase 1